MSGKIFKEINFTFNDILEVQTASTLEEAQELMHTILDHCQTGKNPMVPNKVAFLRHQVDNTVTIEQVAAIGYNMYLVGEGLGQSNSSYQRKLGSWATFKRRR